MRKNWSTQSSSGVMRGRCAVRPVALLLSVGLMAAVAAVLGAPSVAGAAGEQLGSPSWWNGSCDSNNYPGSYPLGASFRGVEACGPKPGTSDGRLVRFYKNAWGEYEWQCTELVFRFMYLAYGVAPYSANGDTVVDNYSTTAGGDLVKVTNGSVGQMPAPGDILSYTTVHTAIVSEVNVDNAGNGSITIVQQNSSNDGWGTLSVKAWKISGVKNWLHDPKGRSLGGSTGASITGASIGLFGSRDPLTDFAIYRPSGGTGWWYSRTNTGGGASGGLSVNGWAAGGWLGDVPMACDFDGDGVSDFVIYRLVNGAGTWYVQNGRTGSPISNMWGVTHGSPGDVPIVGKWLSRTASGLSKTCTYGIYRVNNGTASWYLKDGRTNQPTAIWGSVHGGWPQDVPVMGDFNGDGYADFGIYRPLNGTGFWYVKSSADGQPIAWAWGVAAGGWAQDVPVVGDFNGDGYADFGIYRPSNGTGYWYAKSGVNVSSMVVNGVASGGWPGDIPIAGNFG